MSTFKGVDYYDVEALLSEEERMSRDVARAFTDNEVLPIITAHFREGAFPVDLVRKLGALGFLGANLHGYGCAGLGNVAYGLILQELERGDSGIRSFASVQGALVMYPIRTYGSAAQKARWLPALATGEAIGCFGLTEPDAGSDPGSMMTKAVRVGNEYVLNGTKLWITNGSIADVAVVWAKLDGVIRGFLVERGTPGFSAQDLHGKFSMRASATSELAFQDCRIPADNMLPDGDGLRAPLSCLNQARYGIAWGVIGAAMACYAAALAYGQKRRQFGTPIAAFQLVQQKLVQMLTEITKAQLLCLQLGRLKDANRMHFAQVSLAKRSNVAAALDIARMARDILGANGIMDEYPVVRHMLNLESVFTYEGTHDIHTLIVGRDITGISALEAGA
ncbi:MAG TPA: acyl-CoA dehydrogenase family protein [Candidatus Baltobacteraceae bacterium]|nr:acyl-CoA dehydrogenase family protein [Candidatus Baltobacteraceae bacterium]